jgi:large subunit ribosomal protein L14
MKPIRSRVTKGLLHGSLLDVSDNSGAKIVKIVSVKGGKTVRKRYPSAGIADLVIVSVVKGKPEMRKQVVPAVIVRQKKEIRRRDGTRVKFEDNAVVILKDEKGNPKGTMIKGAIAKEVTTRWPPIAKLAKVLV